MNKKVFFLLFLILNLSLINAKGENDNPDSVFFINLLSPNSSVSRHGQWAALVENQLPKIGIGISYHESTGWGNILPRTWNYPVGDDDSFVYIPTYENGGYDVLFISWSSDLDWYPYGRFDSGGIPGYSVNLPKYRGNLYQYNDSEYDSTWQEYLNTYDDTIRIQKLYKLQEILFHDLPSVSFINLKEIFGISTDIKGINTSLLLHNSHRAENWQSAEDSITYALPAEFREYSPFSLESYNDAQWQQCVYYGLFERNHNTLQMEPTIAADDIFVHADGITIDISINPDAYFSNGDPVTAYDVEYTYELHLNPAVNSPKYDLITTFLENNDSISALDSDTIQFVLKEPNSLVKSQIFNLGIMNKNLVAAYIEDVSVSNPDGYDMNVLDSRLLTSCGPYKLDIENFDTENSRVVLNPNPFWNITEHNMTNELVFRYISGKDNAIKALFAGQVDIIDANFLSVEADYVEQGDIEIVEIIQVNSTGQSEMAINMRHPIIGTGELTPLGTAEAAQKIRTAMSYAFPRDIIITELLQNRATAATSPCPQACIGYNGNLIPRNYSLETAISLMEEAGYEVFTGETTEVFWSMLILMCGTVIIGISWLSRRKR